MSYYINESKRPLTVIQRGWLKQALGATVCPTEELAKELYPDVLNFGSKVAQVELFIAKVEESIAQEAQDVSILYGGYNPDLVPEPTQLTYFARRLLGWLDEAPYKIEGSHTRKTLKRPRDIVRKAYSNSKAKYFDFYVDGNAVFRAALECFNSARDSLEWDPNDCDDLDDAVCNFLFILVYEHAFVEEDAAYGILFPWVSHAKTFWAVEFPELDWDDKP